MGTLGNMAMMISSAFVGGVFAITAYATYQQSFSESSAVTNLGSMWEGKSSKVELMQGLNFEDAAAVATPAVVHIKTFSNRAYSSSRTHAWEEMLREFFGNNFPDRQRQQGQNGERQVGSGSGVIISEDGYITTNNHVIDEASKIEVVLDDKRSFSAEVVGKDPSTDLALLKIKAEKLSFVPFGNSDEVRVGQWVLAVGNPFDLTSTVTAGIISAKARNINILRQNDGLAVESFLQTDAAVNPGNSGGALMNLKGELIGINTAIATQTGSYSGYSFAVPSNLVKKVVEDFKQFGTVQRAILGVRIQDINDELAKKIGLEAVKGVLVANVTEEGAAVEAGIKDGDVILSIDKSPTNSSSALQELVARHRPGDKVEIVYFRKGKTYTVSATLKNKAGNTDVVSSSQNIVNFSELGVDLMMPSQEELEEANTSKGVKVATIHEDGKFAKARIPEGFIITSIDNQPIQNIDDFKRLVKGKKGTGLLVEGFTDEGEKAFFAVAM